MEYSVLIVDDEPLIASNLIRSVPWEQLGCRVVGSACDATSAKMAIDRWRPDIVITDIVMPGETGLSVVTYCAEQGYPCKAIVLSAYHEFSYAQQAMARGVEHYVLKPIDFAILTQAIQSVQRDLNAVYTQLSCQSELYQYTESAKLREMQDLLFAIAFNGYPQAREETARLQMVPFRAGFLVSLYFFNIPYENESGLSSVTARMEDDLRPVCDLLAARSYDKGVFYLLMFRQNETAEQARRRVIDYFRDAILHLPMESGILSAGIGECFSGLENLRAYFVYCGGWQSYGFFQERSVLFLAPPSLPEAVPSNRDSLLQSVRRGDPVQTRSELALYREHLLSLDPGTAVHTMRSLHHQANIIASKVGMQLEEPNDQNCCNENFSRMYEELSKTVLDISRYVMKTSDLVGKLQMLDDAVFFDVDFNLSRLADMLGVNCAYLSRVFKRETGSNFCDYQTYIRIEEAKRLLVTTSLSNAEIAKRCGFLDKRYFAQVFKKKCGMTTSQYREAEKKTAS